MRFKCVFAVHWCHHLAIFLTQTPASTTEFYWGFSLGTKAGHLSAKILSPLKFLYCDLQKEYAALYGNKLKPDKYVTVKLLHDYQRCPTRYAQSHLHMLAISFKASSFPQFNTTEPWGQKLFVVLNYYLLLEELNIFYSQNKYMLYSSHAGVWANSSPESWRHSTILSPAFIEASFLELSCTSSFTRGSVCMLKNHQSPSQVIWGGNTSHYNIWAEPKQLSKV